MADENKMVILDKNNENKIQQYAQDTLSITMQFDHIGDFFASEIYDKGKGMLSEVISDAVTNKYQKDFHKKLNFIEKANFMSPAKKELYEKKCTRINQGSKIAVEFVADSIPLLCQALSNKRNQQNAKEFILEWMGYINQGNEISTLIISNARTLMNAMDLKCDENELRHLLSSDRGLSPSYLPSLNKNNINTFNSMEYGVLCSLAKMVIASADLNEEKTRERALEFINQIFYVGYAEAESTLNDIMAAQQHLTQLLSFSAIDYMVFFNKFISSADEVMRFGTYDINMDPYARIRRKNQETIQKMAETGAQVAINAKRGDALACFQNLSDALIPSKDIFKISDQMMEDTIQPSRAQKYEFINTMADRDDAYKTEGKE